MKAQKENFFNYLKNGIEAAKQRTSGIQQYIANI
jgi:hypothetical protein